MAAFNREGLGWGVQLGTTDTTVHAAASSKKSLVSGFNICNTDTSQRTCELYLVQNSGGSVGSSAASKRLCKLTLPADDTVVYTLPHPVYLLADNDAIVGKSDSATKVTVIPLGDTYTP